MQAVCKSIARCKCQTLPTSVNLQTDSTNSTVHVWFQVHMKLPDVCFLEATITLTCIPYLGPTVLRVQISCNHQMIHSTQALAFTELQHFSMRYLKMNGGAQNSQMQLGSQYGRAKSPP